MPASFPIGLAVNLVSAFLLREEHDHDHHGHEHAHHHRDNNLRAAYVHVLADAATSVLAIAALVTATGFAGSAFAFDKDDHKPTIQ